MTPSSDTESNAAARAPRPRLAPRLLRAGRLLFAAVAIASAAALALLARNGVETDLYGLLDPARRSVMAKLADHLGGQVRVLVEGPSWDALRKPVSDFRRLLGERGRASLNDTARSLKGRTAGLMTDDTRRLLLDGRTAEVAEQSLAMLYSGVPPPLFGTKGDPFLLAADYFANLRRPGGGAGWSLRDGELSLEKDGRCHVLLVAECEPGEAGRTRVRETLDAAIRFNASGKSQCRVYTGGSPFHVLVATESSKSEINFLSTLSFAFAALFGFLLFRSLRFVVPLTLALAFSFLVASAAVFAAFGRPHVLTFLFGTSLIGLGVDYSYHVLSSGDVRRVLKALSLSLATTVACFVPLFFSTVSVLHQMALFTISGLMAVFAFVTLFSRRRKADAADAPPDAPPRPPAHSPARTKRAWALPLAVVAVCAAGAFRLHFGNDPAAFYRPSPFLAESERRIAELNGAADSAFVLVEGADVQSALEREEARGIRGMSALVPSLKRQRENAKLAERLFALEGSNFTVQTGIPVAAPARRDDGALLDPETIDDPLLARLVGAMTVRTGDGVVLVSPLGETAEADVAGAEGVTAFRPKQALLELFDGYAAETKRLLAVSYAVLALMLAVAFRRRFFRVLWPVLAATLSTLGVMGWCGATLNFFHFLCFFVFAGLGLDYSIFHLGKPNATTRLAVRYSFLSSFVGLGMLAFTSFAVTRSMGATLALGLAFAYVFAVMRGPGGDGDAAAKPLKPDGGRGSDGGAVTADATDERESDGGWAGQREQSAGRLRMLFMWHSYALLGKGFLKAVCVPVMAFIYPFARPARAALRGFYAALSDFTGRRTRCSHWRMFRHMLGFAWALADKTDACTLGKNPPKMSVRDDDASRLFRSTAAAGRGAFIVSSHVGSVETLPALARQTGATPPRVHAFQQLGHDAAFTRTFMSHLDRRRLEFHAVEDVGVETAVQMQEAISRGDLVVMAGDRVGAGSARWLVHDFLGRPCRWPLGVFAFARLMDAPVFAVICSRTGWNAYEVSFRTLWTGEGRRPSARDLLDRYVPFVEAAVCERPDQWHHFFDFFAPPAGPRSRQTPPMQKT